MSLRAPIVPGQRLARGGTLTPQQWADLISYQAIQDATRLLGV